MLRHCCMDNKKGVRPTKKLFQLGVHFIYPFRNPAQSGAMWKGQPVKQKLSVIVTKLGLGPRNSVLCGGDDSEGDGEILWVNICPTSLIPLIIVCVHWCWCVCLSVCEDISQSTHMIFTKFLGMLPMAMARSSSDRVTKSQ